MAKPAKKNQSRFGEAMGAFMPGSLMYRPENATVRPAKRLPWTEIGVGALCLVVGFGLGLYLIKPHSSSVATTATPSLSAATFGPASSVLKAAETTPVATSGATTLQPAQTASDVQSAQTASDLQPQSATIAVQGTVSAAELQGSINGPVTTQ
jgi:hypothetical protein